MLTDVDSTSPTVHKVFFGGKTLPKIKPKTTELSAPREKFSAPDHLDMQVSDGRVFLDQQNFN